MQGARAVSRDLPHVLGALSVAALGIFVGAMLTEGFVLVPYWRSLPANEFHAWYAANDRRLLGFFGPVTTVAALSAVATALVSLRGHDRGRWGALLAAMLSAAFVLTFPLYFQRANASFAAATVAADELPAELLRWATWHWARTALGVAALTAALLSLRRVG
jgi:hypothetical protein